MLKISVQTLHLPTLRMANDFALGLTEGVAHYMKAKFLHELQSKKDHVPFPSDWDFTLLQECDQAVGILLQAYRNACKMAYLVYRA